MWGPAHTRGAARGQGAERRRRRQRQRQQRRRLHNSPARQAATTKPPPPPTQVQRLGQRLGVGGVGAAVIHRQEQSAAGKRESNGQAVAVERPERGSCTLVGSPGSKPRFQPKTITTSDAPRTAAPSQSARPPAAGAARTPRGGRPRWQTDTAGAVRGSRQCEPQVSGSGLQPPGIPARGLAGRAV